ncbi:MAG: T9SS type A sorting domain-containing protein [Bacteroidales bacterium]
MLNLQISGEAGDAMIQIMDMTGRVVYDENIFISEEFQKNVDISKLNSGVYFIVLSNNSGRISSKFIKR